jgi:hypothetical protein
MASKAKKGHDTDIKELLHLIRQEIADTSNNLKKSIDQKFENLNKMFNDRMDRDVKEMKTHIDLEIGKLTRKIEELELRVSDIERNQLASSNVQFDPEVTVVAINLPKSPDENTMEEVADLFNVGLKIRDVEPVRVLRLPSREGKPGIVKIELSNREDKIATLRAKTNLRFSQEFRKVFLRTSMSHTDRILQMNFREILKELPNGDTYRIAANGRVLKKDDSPERDTPNDSTRRAFTRRVTRGRGRGRPHHTAET